MRTLLPLLGFLLVVGRVSSPLAQAAACADGPPRTYVAIGASDGVGVGASDPSRTGWVPQLRAKLGEQTHLLNLGVSATTLHEALQEQLPVAVQSDPDLVTVWLAVNDVNAQLPLESYAADLDTLLGTLEHDTHAQLLIGNVPNLTNIPVYAEFDPVLLRGIAVKWNAVIAETAERHHARVVDLFSLWEEKGDVAQDLSDDGFHPSDSGYAKIAQAFENARSCSAAPTEEPEQLVPEPAVTDAD